MRRDFLGTAAKSFRRSKFGGVLTDVASCYICSWLLVIFFPCVKHILLIFSPSCFATRATMHLPFSFNVEFSVLKFPCHVFRFPSLSLRVPFLFVRFKSSHHQFTLLLQAGGAIHRTVYHPFVSGPLDRMFEKRMYPVVDKDSLLHFYIWYQRDK